ncbi:uncharacterized protein [Henckelia pumila]|uniref:uncharacterized protein n=1 Tax=Henckelia pumila TaxID=405737 RepID=UPI003C6DE221
MAVGNGQNVTKFGICAGMGHATDMCHTLQVESTEQVNAVGGFSWQPQQNYDLYSNTFNPCWKDHPNFRYGNPPMNQPAPQETRASIQHLNTHVGQLATTVNRLKALNSNNLPSQTVVNPNENVRAITLRSGRELKVHEKVVKEPVQNWYEEKSKVEEDEIIQEAPRALKESRKDEANKGLYEVFRRCEVNIPLLDAIKQVPRYAKVLKDLCTVKRKQKLKGCQKVKLGEQVSAVILRKAPEKCKDPGPLNKTEIVIQMADRSTIHPRGVLEDVFVQVGNLVFPADFCVLDMKNNDLNSAIFLEIPFWKTSKSIIDVNNDTLTMEFDGEIVKFNIFDTLKIPGCESVVNNIEINDHLSQEHTKDVNEDKLKEVIAQPAKNSIAEIFLSDLQVPKTEPKLPPD